jgi:cell division protein FtsB
MLLNVLIVFFLFLLVYQLYLANNIIEGNQNRSSSSSDDPAGRAYILSLETKAELDKVNKKITNLETQMQELSMSNKEMAQSLPGAGGQVVPPESL